MKIKILKFLLIITLLGGAAYYFIYRETPFYIMTGNTMNTYYRITIRNSRNDTLLHNAIKNELQQINAEMSVFEKMSDISQFNQNSNTGWIEIPENLSHVLKAAYRVYTQTNGYFDPSVGAIIDLWGFGTNKTIKEPSKEEIKAALKNVGLNRIVFSADFRKAKKGNADIYINLSAIAKGYAVDRIAKLLQDNKYEDFLVDIGGEVRALGNRSENAQGWNVGIARPSMESVSDYEYIVRLQNLSVATSGDYRNYYYIDGKRYSHTMDPKTGYPVEHELASVTVFADECMYADALATGIMSMGEKRGLEFANSHKLPIVMFVRTNETEFQTMVSNEGKILLEKIGISQNDTQQEESPKRD